MSPEERTELRRLAEAATPGEWRREGRFIERLQGAAPGVPPEDAVAKVYREEDARYFAALAPERVLALLDRLDAVTTDLRRAEARLVVAREALGGTHLSGHGKAALLAALGSLPGGSP